MSADGSFGLSGQSALVAAWAERLRGMTGRIDSFYLPLEPVFLETGGRLRELYRAVSQLSQNVEAAQSLMSSAETLHIMDGLAGASRNIEAMRSQRGGLAGALSQMIVNTDTINASLTLLTRIMAHTQVLAINARIEASQLLSTGIDFSVFTRDIARLAKSGEQTIEEVRQEMRGLRTAAVQAQALQYAFENKELPELDAVAEQLGGSIQAVRDSIARSERGGKDIPDRVRGFFGHITSLVSDMQVYDMTRQRLEHVEHALALTADMIEAENEASMDPQQQRVFINGIAELQSLQLNKASDHYHGTVDNVARSLTAMAEGVPAVAALCQQAYGKGDAGSLLDIAQSLRKASQVFASFVSTREQAASSLAVVVRATRRAGELMGSLNAVNGDMRLMGLNAAIKCGNMGSIGRVLSVIAQELQVYAAQTGERVQIVADCLKQTAASAQGIVSSDHSANDQVDVETLKREVDQVVLRLELTGNGLSKLMDNIYMLGDSVVTQTREAAAGFSGKAECRQAVADGMRALAALAADTDTGLTGAALEEARRAVLAFTESHYTMACERTVHGVAVDGRQAVDLLTGADTQTMGSGEATGGEPDIDDLLF